MGPGVLSQVLEKLQKNIDENLLVGFDGFDDASIYKLTEDIALIQTLDFFTPIVDEPYLFGSIAATNALSDVYAMGGKPITALNIVMFPDDLDKSILEEILKGGADKVKESGAVLSGGHSIVDKEPKYGLSVSGIVNPNEFWRNSSVKDEDIIIITKPLGTGIISTAKKKNKVSDEIYKESIKYMTMLNKYSSDIARKFNISACTDITGFGLLGHLSEMIKCTGHGIILEGNKIPKINGVDELIKKTFITGGSKKNRDYLKGSFEFKNYNKELDELVFDPQTSGGLIFSIPKSDYSSITKELKEAKIDFWEIGRVVKDNNEKIIVL